MGGREGAERKEEKEGENEVRDPAIPVLAVSWGR